MQHLVAFIAGEPGMAQRLLAQHRADDAGRCTGCRAHNRGTPVHPCLTALAAQAALKSAKPAR